MITGETIAQSMAGIFRRKKNIYDSESDRMQTRLPVTMRQLVESDFDR